MEGCRDWQTNDAYNLTMLPLQFNRPHGAVLAAERHPPAECLMQKKWRSGEMALQGHRTGTPDQGGSLKGGKKAFVTPTYKCSRGRSLLPGHGTLSTSRVGGWRLAAVGGWRLVVPGGGSYGQSV